MSIFNPDDYDNENNNLNTTNLDKLYLKKTGSTSSNALTSFLNDTNMSNINLLGNIISNGHIISPVELSYLDNVTSNIQTQINNFSAGTSILQNDNTFTGKNTFNNELTINNNIKLNDNTIIDQNELRYLNNTTSNIQNQINNKIDYIINPTNNNICSMNSTGQVVNNGLALTIDDNLTLNSNSLIPSSQAIKNYVDNKLLSISTTSTIGQSIQLFLSNIQVETGYERLLIGTPDTNIEDIEQITLNNNRVLLHSYITDNLNRTKINSGIFSGNIYCYVDDIQATTNIQLEFYIRDGISNIETLKFTMISNDINISSVGAIIFNYTLQNEIILNNLSDKLVVKLYGFTNRNSNVNLFVYHSGNQHNSFITTPLIYSHNSLDGLNNGDYKHLTQNEYNLVTSNSSSTQTGLLLNTDWNNFNNKQDQINNTTDLLCKSLLIYNYGDVKTKIDSKNDIINSTTDLTIKSLNITNYGDIQTKINSKNDLITNTTDLETNKITSNFFYTRNNVTDLQTQINNLANQGSVLLSLNNTWTGINNFTNNITYLSNIVVNGSTITALKLEQLKDLSTTATIQAQLNNKQQTINNTVDVSVKSLSIPEGNILDLINTKQQIINSSSNLICNTLNTVNGNVDTNLGLKQNLINNTSNLICNSISTTLSGDIDSKINTKQNTLNSSSNITVNKITLTSGDIDTQLLNKQDKLTTGTNISINDLTINGVCKLGVNINNLESYLSTLQSNIYKYNKVLYVSKLGSDLNGDGSLNNPYLTVGKCLNSVYINTGIAIIIFPGVYSENVDFTYSNNITISGCVFDNRQIIQIDGNLTFSNAYSASVNNITCRAVIHTGSGSLYLNYVNLIGLSTVLASSSSGYLRCDNVIMETTKQIYFNSSSSGQKVFINNCQLGQLLQMGNNCITKIDGCELVFGIDLQGGILGINNTPIYYPYPPAPAIVQSANTYLYLTNLSILDLSNNATIINLANNSIHSFSNVVFKKIGSTINGNYISTRKSYNDYLSCNNLIVGDTLTETTITSNELKYLSGLTSNIQQQINNISNTAKCVSIKKNNTQYSLVDANNLIKNEQIIKNSFTNLSTDGGWDLTNHYFIAKIPGFYCVNLQYRHSDSNENFVGLSVYQIILGTSVTLTSLVCPPDTSGRRGGFYSQTLYFNSNDYIAFYYNGGNINMDFYNLSVHFVGY